MQGFTDTTTVQYAPPNIPTPGEPLLQTQTGHPTISDLKKCCGTCWGCEGTGGGTFRNVGKYCFWHDGGDGPRCLLSHGNWYIHGGDGVLWVNSKRSWQVPMLYGFGDGWCNWPVRLWGPLFPLL